MKITQSELDEITFEIIANHNYPLSYENVRAIMGEPVIRLYEIKDSEIRLSLLRIEKRGEIRQEILAIPGREYQNRRYYRMLCPQKRTCIVLN